MKIKICGLFRQEDILAVNEALPDYVGFVFAKSRRQVTKEVAQSLKKNLDPAIQVVGVFVDAPIDEIAELQKQHIIDVIQLHGNENQQYIRNLKSKTGCEIIKAVSVKTWEDIEKAQRLDVDFLLLDQGPGGTGRNFSWDIVTQWQTGGKGQPREKTHPSGKTHSGAKPFFLAGGVDAANLSQAMKVGSPYGIDVSSGVETNGFKDKDKILEIVRSVKNE